MPRQYLMTYVPGRKGWMKFYRGKSYAVPCAQLGVSPGKEASYIAANARWEQKKTELDQAEREEAAKAHPRSAEIVSFLDRHTGRTFGTGQEATAALFDVMTAGPHPDGLNEAILGPDRVQRIDELVRAFIGGDTRTEPERPVASQVERWLGTLRAGVSTRNLSAGRWDAYARNVRHFAGWLGTDADVSVLTAAKLEAFYGWVCERVAGRKWSPATAAGVFMTARQFIRWLAESGAIPLPCNIASRRFKFGTGAREVETFTDDEVKTLISAATERTRLYLLLMLNCGMYQNDIAELAVSEVDWKAGTVTRKRSKTRGRKDAPTVSYKLWPETLRLLKAQRAKEGVPNGTGGVRVLLTTDGKPLVYASIHDRPGKHTGWDAIQSAYHRLCEKIGVRKPLKCFRKTAASKLVTHPEYGAFVQHFLAHTPKGMTDRHYVKPDGRTFDEAVAWLGTAFTVMRD